MLIGHSKIIADLKRLAKSGGLSHGYIFFGPSMVGKRTTAQALAKFLEKGSPSKFLPGKSWDGKFETLREGEPLQDSMTIDVAFARRLNPEKKSDEIGIDAVRELKGFLWQKPGASARRTAIIDDGELLTAEAQNALLKITEEPPQSSLLILITNDIDGLLPTISSRLQKIYFSTVPEKEIFAWLTESATEEKPVGAKARADISSLVAKSANKPGLAWRMAHDEEFRAHLKSAQNLLKSTSGERKEMLKKMMDDEAFDLGRLLDAMILAVAAEGFADAKRIARWHKFLALRQNVANYNLNPKLQMENLFT